MLRSTGGSVGDPAKGGVWRMASGMERQLQGSADATTSGISEENQQRTVRINNAFDVALVSPALCHLRDEGSRTVN